MTDLTSLREQMVHALVFNVACNRTLSRGDKRRFFAQMRRTLAASGYAMSQFWGFCVVVPLHRQEPHTGRHDVLNWLVDQVETAKVIVYQPMSVSELLTGRFAVLDGQEQALDLLPAAAGREFIRRIAAGAVTQALRRLQRPRAHELPWRQTVRLP